VDGLAALVYKKRKKKHEDVKVKRRGQGCAIYLEPW
jgi:hypothetical protein